MCRRLQTLLFPVTVWEHFYCLYLPLSNGNANQTDYRDYLKKISAIRRRKIGPREMSPACALINSVISTSRRVENVTINDRMTEAAGFLLQQHQAYYPDPTENDEPLDTKNGVKESVLLQCEHESRNANNKSLITFVVLYVRNIAVPSRSPHQCA
ncbi:unnamed protein product [Gongylonema pulchrum]|uniref:Uncharacterized protein n=1 Tax=Gongylonema pulchrum TaxID=637853 RepID=A0A183ERT3_9BILA|nr:unnamed protein product [Gongylonema pulchrum]